MTRFLLFDFGYRYDPSSHCSTALVCLWLLVSLLHGTPPHSCSPEAQRTPTCVTCCMEPGLAGGLDPMISCGPFRPLPLCSSVIPPGSHRPHRESAVLCGTWVQSPPYPQQFLPCCLVWRGLISAGAAVHLPAIPLQRRLWEGDLPADGLAEQELRKRSSRMCLLHPSPPTSPRLFLADVPTGRVRDWRTALMSLRTQTFCQHEEETHFNTHAGESSDTYPCATLHRVAR